MCVNVGKSLALYFQFCKFRLAIEWIARAGCSCLVSVCDRHAHLNHTVARTYESGTLSSDRRS